MTLKNWVGKADQHDGGSWWLDWFRGQELRTGDGYRRRVLLLSRLSNGITVFFCLFAIHTRYLGQRWCARWPLEFGIEADSSGKVTPESHVTADGVQLGWCSRSNAHSTAPAVRKMERPAVADKIPDS